MITRSALLTAMGGTAALTLLALGMTAAAAGEPGAEAATPHKHETVIVKVIRKDGKDAMPDEMDSATFPDGACKDSTPTVDTSSESRDAKGEVRRSRILICNKGGAASPADLVARLEDARKRVADVSELSAEAKAKALASLDEEIARLKAAK